MLNKYQFYGPYADFVINGQITIIITVAAFPY